jgi:HK97 family phage major capsid protein
MYGMPKNSIKDAEQHLFVREVSLREQRVNADTRTIELAFSSEAPYERFFGMEILDHGAASVRLGRLNDGSHPLLVNHDTNQQAGVVEKAWLDADKVGRATVRFGKSPYAQEIFADVKDGIRTLVSVGYRVHEVEEVITPANGGEPSTRTLSGDEFRALACNDAQHQRATQALRDRGEPLPTYRVTDWEPFEVSIVAVPADASVGVGRSADLAPAKPAISTTVKAKTMENVTQKDPTQLEAERRDGILNMGEQYAKYVGQKDIADALRNGRTVEQFKDVILQKMESRHSDTSELAIGMKPKEIQRYSLARALVASVTGDWSKAGLERECSQAVANVLGRSPEGFYVPHEAFQRDFNLGTSSEAGNLRETVLRTDLYVDALRNAMVVTGMGVRVLSGLVGNVDIPRKSTASTLGMLAEIGSASETNPATAKVSLSPKRVGAYIEVSKQALIQSAMALESMLRDDLLMGSAVLIESQMINGVGSSNEMTGIRNTSSIGTVAGGSNGAALVWSHLVDLESACANSNAEPGQLAGYVTNTRVRGKAKQVTKSTYMPFLWTDGATPLNGYRVGITNNVPSNLTKGTSTTVCSAAIFASDWSMGVLGLFGAPDVTVDPYSKADTGQVKITLNQFADFGVRQPSAFAKIEDILTT